MYTRWKLPKSLRLARYVVESLLALLLGALIVMESSWFQHWLEGRVITGLEDLTGGRVEMAGFRFRPWLFQLTLGKLVIHGSEPAGEPPLISARNVAARLNPGPLLRHRLRLRSRIGIDLVQ